MKGSHLNQPFSYQVQFDFSMAGLTPSYTLTCRANFRLFSLQGRMDVALSCFFLHFDLA